MHPCMYVYMCTRVVYIVSSVSPCFCLGMNFCGLVQFQFQFVYSQPIRIEAEKGRMSALN